MLAEQSVNPYAPTVAENTSAVKTVDEYRCDDFATNTWVLLTTFIGISASGAVFGAGLMMVAVLSGSGAEMIWAVGIAIGFGAIYAGIVAVPVILVGLLVSLPLRSGNLIWLPGEMRLFAIGCGFCAGFCSVAAPMRFLLEPMMFAFVPGTVGMLGTWIVVERMAIRRVIDGQHREPNASGTLPNHPEAT